MIFNSQALAAVLQRYPSPRRWLVGFSGGLDSTALLHALLACKPAIPIVAVHVNHGLSPNANRWQQHCEAVARRWQLPFVCEQVTVENSGQGIENAARQARFAVFEKHVQAGDTLLLAHHLDDQAETLLYRLMRGAGPRGLGAMQTWRPFYHGHMLRPLLEFSRRSIAGYAAAEGLSWIDDDSNEEQAFDRNYLRHQVLPLLARRWPDFQQRWSQAAALCREAEQLNGILAAQDLAACDARVERLGFSVDFRTVSALAPPRRRNLLRYWSRQHDGAVPELSHLQEVERQFFGPAPAAGATVCWGGEQLRCFGGRLFLLPRLSAHDTAAQLHWPEPREPLSLPDGSCLAAQPVAGGGLALPAMPLTVRWRQGGERCQPQQREHSQTLKKLLQEYRLEPWLRDRVPLVYAGDALAAVGDLWVCKDFLAQPRQSGLALRWHYPQPRV